APSPPTPPPAAAPASAPPTSCPSSALSGRLATLAGCPSRCSTTLPTPKPSPGRASATCVPAKRRANCEAYFGVRWLDTALDGFRSKASKAVSSHRATKRSPTMPHAPWSLPCLVSVLFLGALCLRGASSAPLRAGFAEADIAPAVGGDHTVYMAGFGQNRKATGVHDPLKARAV